MTKRLTIAVMIILMLTGPALAASAEGPTLALRAGAFFPSDDVFNEVYGKSLVFGADVSVPLKGVLRFWAGAEFLSKTGLLPVSLEETKLRIIPLFAGLRVQFGQKSVRPYIGAAAAYFLFREENPLGAVSEGALGLITQAGLLARLGGAVWIDMFAGYRDATVSTGGDDPLEAKLGGLSAGLGLAYKF
jgi:hypothetical protein